MSALLLLLSVMLPALMLLLLSLLLLLFLLSVVDNELKVLEVSMKVTFKPRNVGSRTSFPRTGNEAILRRLFMSRMRTAVNKKSFKVAE